METNSLIIGIVIGLGVGVVVSYVIFKSHNELTKAISQLPAQSSLQPQLFEIERDEKGRLKTMVNASIAPTVAK